MQFQRVKGFQDIYGEAAEYWDRLAVISKELFRLFQTKEIILPVLEKSELFNHGIGETTDIVEKEMFSFQDKDGSALALRPEGTAGALRAYIENGCPKELERLYYYGHMFRRENPQKGRFRQFSQAGAEFIGTSSPFSDAEMILLFTEFFRKAGVAEFSRLEINSVGCAECRPTYLEKLTAYLNSHTAALCGDCNRRLLKNPLRTLDCKNEQCAPVITRAPVILDSLCPVCAEHFEEVKKFLKIYGVDYKINPYMVRGLDYYTRTAFEMVTGSLGAASALGGGGRYDKLIKRLGGPDVGGVGFAVGLDRVVALMRDKVIIDTPCPEVYIVTFPETFEQGAALLGELRRNGIRAAMEGEAGGVKAQMKRANRVKARYSAILGEEELKSGSICLKEMETSSQQLINSDQILNFLRSDKC
jgi:histidyl-tRNA synthetase